MSRPRLGRIPSIVRTALFSVSLASTVPTLGAAQQAFTVDDVLAVSTASVREISPNGEHVLVSTRDLMGRLGTSAARTGDPTYVSPSRGEVWMIDVRTGARTPLLDATSELGSAVWSPNGEKVALTRYDRAQEHYELGLLSAENPSEVDWVRLPDGLRLAGEQGQSPAWTPDGEALVLPVRPGGWYASAQEEFSRLVEGPITVYRGDDPFLAWEALRRRGGEVGLVRWDVGADAVTPLVDKVLLGRSGFDVVPASAIEGRSQGGLVLHADVTEKTSYDVIFGAEVEVRTLGWGDSFDEARTVTTVPEDRRLTWSDDGAFYAYADKGDVFLGSIGSEATRRLTGKDAADGDSAGDSDDSEEERPRFSVLAVENGGERVAVSSKAGLWLVDVESGDRTRMIELPEDEDEAETPPRYRFQAWAPNGDLYFRVDARTEWDRGMVRWDSDRSRLEPLFRDGRLYNGFQLSEDGGTWIYQAAQGNRPYDVFAADSDFNNERLLFESNPQIAGRALGDSELIDYLDVDGDRLYGVLYYPVNYVAGTRVPTIFLVYEQFFDDRFNSTVALLNNAGYAVMQPSVDLETGFPGEAWLKGVTAAANTLIERGIADPDRMGVHGTSYGGYATNLLVTQTDRFAAAINISGKVDMISFYTDSPRLGVRNIHAPENSQDRIGATLWEQPQKYIAHSAIMAADRIETPLLLMTGEEDHNVPARTTLEMYFALRRLGKTVEWVNYVNGGHGMPRTTELEVRDYHTRILDWYDRFLKDDGKTATQP